MRANIDSESERGQAYTLEGFVSAMVVLMAVLFAMQAVVISPTTGGLADRTIQSQIEQEAQDALVLGATANGSEGNRDLSTLVRYWDDENGEFFNSQSDDPNSYYRPSNDTEFANNFTLGKILTERFDERGKSYNVDLVYQNENGEFDSENSTYLVSQGESEAVTASYTITLYESDTLTAPGDEGPSLRDAYYCKDTKENPSDYEDDDHGEDCYPIPPATDHPNTGGSEIYNVVEVRVAVW